MFQKLLQTLGLAPKSLDQAHATITEAKATLDSVAALFTAAGLNLEQMLAAGPDSLKAHLASLDNTAEVTRLTSELATAKDEVKKYTEGLNHANSALEAHAEIFETIGLQRPAGNSCFDGKTFKSAWEAHVAKATTLALAKTGHPPAHVPAAAEPTPAAKTDAEIKAEYATITDPAARQAFYDKHEKALWRSRSQ